VSVRATLTLINPPLFGLCAGLPRRTIVFESAEARAGFCPARSPCPFSTPGTRSQAFFLRVAAYERRSLLAFAWCFFLLNWFAAR